MEVGGCGKPGTSTATSRPRCAESPSLTGTSLYNLFEITLTQGCRIFSYVEYCNLTEIFESGSNFFQILLEGELGFVGDYKPDLQVAEVLSKLYFGRMFIFSFLF